LLLLLLWKLKYCVSRISACFSIATAYPTDAARAEMEAAVSGRFFAEERRAVKRDAAIFSLCFLASFSLSSFTKKK